MLAILSATLLSLSAGAAEFEKGEDGGILVPENAETLFYSGSISFAMPEGCERQDIGKEGCESGDMEAQGTKILQGFKEKLEGRGWSLENVVRVNVYGVAGDDGKLDFSGFNNAFAKFFSREDRAAGRGAQGYRSLLYSLRTGYCPVAGCIGKANYRFIH